ncbi:hypothetical protein SPRG_21361 [Saprolegnia parasitica CBS 223.65]|uniref:Uncharacterized protein n=1 Tax=Saprolegnia parasitica (strain CBS 223.65) TaxID=695850 RepID=A0A067C1Q2_SAPPC|nr:hypothetical protein SPRG_21361 [Saprolegnia parasitica CBS 223.65]KDO20702.1 hypothetical protein SPRG_21361 [Saprolegnia parasitica CBS 223.65]|eukprot:XP_012208603.1 hypothetical protein SPRG_21361 [Saprolegnia parasitica CBS 223.65]
MSRYSTAAAADAEITMARTTTGSSSMLWRILASFKDDDNDAALPMGNVAGHLDRRHDGSVCHLEPLRLAASLRSLYRTTAWRQPCAMPATAMDQTGTRFNTTAATGA